VAERPRCEIETDPEGRLLRHFERPGSAVIFAPTGCGGKMLVARLREAGVEVAEIGESILLDPDADKLVQRLIFARARGEKIALFAPGVEALRRWCEERQSISMTEDGKLAVRWTGTNWGLWELLKAQIREGTDKRAGRLVMSLAIADAETGRLFGLRPGDLEPGTAAVLV
jgi:hypothetical protein